MPVNSKMSLASLDEWIKMTKMSDLTSFSLKSGFPSPPETYFQRLKTLCEKGLETRMGFEHPLDRLLEYAQDKMKEGGRDRDLPELIGKIFGKNEFPEAPSWVENTDLSHTIAGLDYLTEICNKEKFSRQEQKIVLSAFIMHDCAYPRISGSEEFTNPRTREVHMREGAKAFREFAEKVASNSFSENEVNQIEAIIGQHDNPSIGKDFDYSLVPNRRLLYAHREADRLWMLDSSGFTLDLLRKFVKGKNCDSYKHLKHVVGRHIQEAELYSNKEECQKLGNFPTLYRTATGFKIFGQLIGKLTSDCRICEHYSYDHDCEVESFSCGKGHFKFTDYGADKQEGTYDFFGCGGRDFKLNPNSRWADVYLFDK